MIARLIGDKLRSSPKSILMLGPRQVGKSTLLKSLEPDMVVNLGLQVEYLNFSANPSELEERIMQARPKSVLIDEIQRLPDLLNTIQVLIDQDKKLKFYLSGSSARKLKRGSANLLPGRLFTYRLGPLSCLEVNFEMDSKKALEVGTLPEPYFMDDRDHAQKLLQSYAATYLQEEILAESLTRNIQGFSRFLKVAAENSGQFLDFSKVATKAKVNRSAARRFYEILEDTLICDRLEAYEDPDFDLVKHSKFYFFDIGVVNALLENFNVSADRRGLAFEHLFFNQVKNISYALDLNGFKINHFRTRGGLEIDFIIQTRVKKFAIELKVSDPSHDELRSLKLLEKTSLKSAEKFVACLHCQPRKVGDITILPWQKVLEAIFMGI